jgi:ubiquinone/menaquinone biosynthesis C-methylase UbiE
MDTMPSPARIFGALTGYQRTAALKAAIDLDLFTGIGAGDRTVEALAGRSDASPAGIRRLCDALVADGFLTKDGDVYGLTTDAAVFLDKSSPAYVGSMAHFLTSPTITECFARLTDAVRRGGTALDGDGTMAPDHPVWVDFARSMAPAAGMSAALMTAILGPVHGTVLDIAAGHGLFGVTVAKQNADVRVIALDWKNVLQVARENAHLAGVADRFTELPGSAFDTPLGADHALVLVPNFLHHFDLATCETFLLRVHASLAPGGRVAIVEFIPNEDRVTPPEAAMFGLTMLASTSHGDAWTFAEYERVLRASGFSNVTMHEMPPSPNRLVIAAR